MIRFIAATPREHVEQMVDDVEAACARVEAGARPLDERTDLVARIIASAACDHSVKAAVWGGGSRGWGSRGGEFGSGWVLGRRAGEGAMAVKVALVTGASSGIGEATALKLQELGFTVYGAARRVERMS